MPNSINTNIAAYYAQANISSANSRASSSIARLSSGNRIVKASDDVAALSVGTSLRTQVTSLRTALLNANQGSSLLQVADGAMAQVIDILQRQKAIATQATSGSLTSTERSYLNQEFQALTSQIDQISESTNFNGVNLLGGGLGTKLRLANTSALAALMDPTSATANDAGQAVASTLAIQAFNVTDGTLMNGSGAAGKLEITDSGGTVLANGAYDGVNTAVQGKFEKFEITDVVFGTAATVKATIGGVEFKGTVANAATTALLQNGTTYIKIGMAALTTTNAGTVQASLANLYDDFRNTSVMRVNQVQGVNFEDTRLEGATGTAAFGVAMARLHDSTRADISDFRYVGNGGTDENTLAVTVNGETFVAQGVDDLVDGATNAVYQFEDGTGQALLINITNHNANGDAAIGNIRTNGADRQAFLDALNIGFSRAGGGISFGVGSTSADKIAVQIRSASSVSLFGGQTLNVNTSADANTASDALDIAIRTATAIRADIGGLQSRFNFASANLESSIQNQDAARSTLLDTDVSSESTAFATAQVQLQAGIAVLSQANLLQQNLLKLIG